MTQNGANKHNKKLNGHNSAQAEQPVPHKKVRPEQKFFTSSPEEEMLIRLELSRTKVEQPFDILNSPDTSWPQRARAIQILVEQGHQPATARRIEDCSHDTKEDVRVRIAAIRALGVLRKAGYGSREMLFRLLWQLNPQKSSDVALYAEVVETLASLGPREWNDGKEFKKQLLQILSNPKTAPAIRAALVRLFATSGKDTPIKAITALLDEPDVDLTIREAIVSSLDALYTTVFEKLLYDPEPSIRVSAFYRLDKENALKHILQDLKNNRNHVIKERAAQLAGEVGKGTPEEIHVLATVAQNKSNATLVRMSAILAVGQLRERHPDVKEPELFLQHLREDSDISIRVVAEAVTDIFYPPSSYDDTNDDDGNDQ